MERAWQLVAVPVPEGSLPGLLGGGMATEWAAAAPLHQPALYS